MPDLTLLDTEELKYEFAELRIAADNAAKAYDSLGRHATEEDDLRALQKLDSFDEPLAEVKRELIARGMLHVITG